MHRIIILLTLLFLLAPGLSAQPGWQKVDSVTWKLYENKQWKALYKEAGEAFAREIDFYYLKVRAGVAAWHLAKYRPAIRHFQKALEKAPDDEFVNAWHYSALAMAGREDEANALADRLTEEVANRLQINRKGFVSSVSLETQLTGNGKHASLIAGNMDSEGSYSNYRSVLDQMWYKNLGMDHHLSARFNLYHSFSHIGIDRTQHFFSTPNQLDALKETNSSQFQYFVQGRLIPGEGWQTTLAYSKVWGTSYYNYPDYQGTAGDPVFPRLSYEINDNQWSLGIAKEMAFLRPRLAFTSGRINGFRQFQATGQIIFYPLGNLHLYFLSEGTYHSDQSREQPKAIFTQKAGIKTGPLWLIGEATFGTVKNYSSEDGMVIYNMPETITGMVGATLWIPLFRYRGNLAVRYLLSEKRGTTFVYTDEVTYSTRQYDFMDQSLLISLKWNL